MYWANVAWFATAKNRPDSDVLWLRSVRVSRIFLLLLNPAVKKSKKKKITREFIIRDDETNDSERCSVRCKLFESVKRTRVPPTVYYIMRKGRPSTIECLRPRSGRNRNGRAPQVLEPNFNGNSNCRPLCRGRDRCASTSRRQHVLLFVLHIRPLQGLGIEVSTAVFEPHAERLAVFLRETMSHETTI